MFSKTGLKKFFVMFVTFVMTVTCMLPTGGVQAWAEDSSTIVVNNTTLSPSVGVYTDSNHTNKADASGTTVKPGDTLYGQWAVTFTEDYKPTAAATTVVYNLPSNITVKEYKSNVDLYDDNTNTLAGTWSLVKGENGDPDQIVLHYNESYLASHSENIQAHVDFDFTLNKSGLKEGNTEPISFFGNTDPITITIGDSGVTGSKSAGTYDPTTGKVSWTITLNPAAATDNVTITDTLGNNLSFDEGSFTVSKDYGTATAVTDVIIDGQQAAINLGSLEKGRYDIKYTTSVSESALEGLQNGQNVSNVGNSMKWSWGSTPGKHESDVVDANGPAISYDMIGSKGAASDSTSDNIKWVVTLNNGNLKANMAGYKFTDTLQDTDKHEYTGSYVVKDASGNQVATGDLNAGDTSFTYTFAADATAQKYTIEYSTKFKTGTSASATVKNTASVEGDLTDSATGQFTGTDTTTYLTKTLTDESQKNSGVANWSSTITSSAMDASTSSLVYTDHLQTVSNAETTYSDITIKIADGDTLTEGTDYTVTQSKVQSWDTYSTLTITFTADGLAKFMGTSDVEVSYTTTTTDTVNGTYTNHASIQNTNWSAEASYVINSNAPAINKPAGTVAWDASYDWGDGTKGAWVTTWSVRVNETGNNKPGVNIYGKTITITDDLAGMDYVSGSAQIRLRNYNNIGNISDWGWHSLTPAFNDGKATFTWDVAGVSGTEYYDCVELEYKTAIKASDSKLPVATATTFTNKASGSAGDITFPEGTGTTTITNKVLDKKGAGYTDSQGDHVYDKDSNTAKYTVDVNQAALDLDANSDTLTLTDTLSAAGTFLPSTLKVVNADTQTTVDYKVSVEDGEDGATKIVLTMPDAQHLTITYSVRPNASAGEEVTLSNTVEFAGITGSASGKEDSFTVANASGGTSGDTGDITVTKYSADSITDLLQGATFKLYSVDLDSGNRTEVKSATTNASGVATFEEVAADTLYVVVETAAPSGYTKSDKETYIVRRAKDASGNFTDAETYASIIAKAKDLGIENISTNLAASYFDEKSETVTGSATITATKTLTGATLAAEQFSFKLQEVDVNGLAVENGVSETVKNDADGKVAFSELTNLAVGTHYYTVSEVVPEDADKAAGITYDSTVYNVTVTIDEKGNSTVAYSKNGETVDAVAFTNTYTKPAEKTATATINISKSVQGDNASADEEFTFDLYDGDTKLGTVTTTAGNVASFDAISFTESDLAGAESKGFTYTIKEQAKTGDAWFDVTGSITAKVTLSKDANGDLQATVDYSVDGNEQQNAYLYTNKYSTATATIGVSKEINGANPTPDEQFTFDLYKGTDKIDSVSVKGGDSATYQNLTFDTVGEYTYTIKETAKLGWTNETGDVTVTVNVARDTENNELKATVSYSSATEDKSSALFTNKYSVGDATATIKISKNVIGDNANENEQFKFELFDSEDKSLGEVTCKGGETKSFADLTFSKTGTYTYKIKETSDLGYGWSNETGDVTATVTVSQNQETGNLEAKVEYTSHLSDDATTALITNKYDQPASAEPTISVNKKVAGDNPQAEETFTFELQDENGNKVEGVDTIELKADETKSFEGLKLNEEGTFTYTIHETSDNGAGWTNAQDVTATVKVSYDKESNSYKVDSVEYSTANEEKNAAFFENVFKAADVTIKVNKKVHGDNAKADETFTFELQDEEGKFLETIKLKADETKEFTSIKKGVGTYKYNIHETSQNGEGWTNDQDIKLVVEVYEENGELKVKYTYTKDSDGSTSNEAAFFVNEYKAPETPKNEEKKETKKKAMPQTGDTTPVSLAVGLGAAGLVSVGAGVAATRRKRNEK